MNPLDLPGPTFLLFYVGLMVVVLLALVYFRDGGEEGPLPKVSELGPYAMAYMRAGASEMLCVAAVSLLDRGLLEIHNGQLVAKVGSSTSARRPFERALLSYFSTPKPASLVLTDQALVVHTAGTENDLVRLGALPTAEQRAQRFFRTLFGLLILGGLGILKIVVALARGHSNVFLLVLLTAASIFLITKLQKKTLTRLGDRTLGEAQALCAPLRDRSASMTLGEGSYELSLLIGAFGLSALHGAARTALMPLFPAAFAPRPSTSDSGSGSSSSSTSCGSSCSSSCGGGSCGGGGCGGCGGD